MKKLVRIVLPEKNFYQGIFLQLYIGNEPFMRFAEGKNASYKNLIIKTLKENDVSYESGYMGIPLPGDNYKMVGNGKVIKLNNEFILSKHLGGLGPDRKHLEDLTHYLSERIKFTLNKD